LRSGWRIAIFVAIVTALSAMMIGVLLRAGAKLPTGGVVTPGIILTQEIPLLLATLAAALMMSHIEQRPFVSYGLPLQSAFGGQFWRGVVWGLVMIAVAILAIAVAGGVSFNGIALHGRGLILQTLLWAVVFLSVGLWEEFFWRGYVLATLAEGIATARGRGAAASPSIESQSPSLISTSASRAQRPATSIDNSLQPTMHGFPNCRATSAACAVRPPTAVTIPAAMAKPPTSAVVVSGRMKMTGSPLAAKRAALSGSKTARPTAMPVDAQVPRPAGSSAISRRL
jgi:hypothetical protein